MTNEQMIRQQIVARGVRNERVLEAMRVVDRKWFVPPHHGDLCYADSPLAIDHGQTISQPYVVALMTELLDPAPESRVLEIGCGTGYQTAILSQLAREVWSLEIVVELAKVARGRLWALGFANAHVVDGNGWLGAPDHGPFDRILVTAAPEAVPDALLRQLAPGGRMVLPVGRQQENQELTVLEKTALGTLVRRKVGAVHFVPMVHEVAGDLTE